MKYRAKPCEIEAMQYLREENISEIQDWIAENNSSRDLIFKPFKNDYYIRTLEGECILTKGDYIIKGVKGVFYPCKPDVFEMKYEPVVTLHN